MSIATGASSRGLMVVGGAWSRAWHTQRHIDTPKLSLCTTDYRERRDTSACRSGVSRHPTVQHSPFALVVCVGLASELGSRCRGVVGGWACGLSLRRFCISSSLHWSLECSSWIPFWSALSFPSIAARSERRLWVSRPGSPRLLGWAASRPSASWTLSLTQARRLEPLAGSSRPAWSPAWDGSTTVGLGWAGLSLLVFVTPRASASIS